MVRVQTAPGTSITMLVGGGGTANDAEFDSGTLRHRGLSAAAS